MTHPDSSDEREFALRQAPRRYADRTAKPPDPALLQTRQATFRRFLADGGIRPVKLARLGGLPSANALYNFLHGRSATLALPTLEAIQRAVPGASVAEMIDEQRPARIVPAAKAPTIRQALTAPFLCNTDVQPDGMDLDVTQLGAARAGAGAPADISVLEGIVPPTGDLFIVRVTTPGAELMFPPGSLLVCKAASDLDGDLPDGTLVILRCRANGSTRVDIREVEHFNDLIWLWQRSTHPHHQTPLPGPRPLWGSDRVFGGETITIIGIVLASCSRLTCPERIIGRADKACAKIEISDFSGG